LIGEEEDTDDGNDDDGGGDNEKDGGDEVTDDVTKEDVVQNKIKSWRPDLKKISAWVRK